MHVIGGRLVIFFELDIFPQHDVGQFHHVKTGQLEIRTQLFQFGQFQAQEIFVPSAVQGELVVRDDVSPLLLLGLMAEIDARDLLHSELFCRGKPPVSGNDSLVAVDEYRIRETKLPDAPGDLRNLLFRMRSWIFFVRHNIIQRPVLDIQDTGLGYGLFVLNFGFFHRILLEIMLKNGPFGSQKSWESA